MGKTLSVANIQTKLTREQREAVGLLSIGTFLEYFDLMLYVHMAVLLNELFFPNTDVHSTQLLSAFAFCTTYLLRPFGALIFGYIGDMFGRKLVVIITTFMMALSCFVMANLPTYAQIGIFASYLVTLCRVLQGLSSMGEFIGAQLYLTEITSPPIQYPVVALTSVFSILGGVGALAVASLSTSYGFNWRSAFWFGAMVALIGAVARNTLKETADFISARKAIDNSNNFSSLDKVENNLLKRNIKNRDNKTFIALFIMECGWPVCFYFSYVFCGNILKQEFGFSPSQIIQQNFVVSIVQLIGIIVLVFMSYRIYPPKIVKAKLVIFIIVALLSPFLINAIHSPYTVFFIQCCFMLFACDYVPAIPLTYKHLSVFRRFTYSSFSYALSRLVMYIITSFGLVYLVEYFGYFGLLVVMIPVIIGYTFGIYYFEKLEQEAGIH